MASDAVEPDVKAEDKSHGFLRLIPAMFLGDTEFIRRPGFLRGYEATNISCFLCLEKPMIKSFHPNMEAKSYSKVVFEKN